MRPAIWSPMGLLGGLLGGAGRGGDNGHNVRRPRTPGPKSGLRKASCGCDRNIRVAPSVLAAAPITCGECGEDFTLA